MASWVDERGGSELDREREDQSSPSPSPSPSPITPSPFSFMSSLITQKEQRKDIEEIEKEERGLRLESDEKKEMEEREKKMDYFNGKREKS